MLERILNDFRTSNEIDIQQTPQVKLSVSGQGVLPSCFRATDLATNSLLVAAKSLAEFANVSGASFTKVDVDQRLASLWFAQSMYPKGWQLPPAWDEIAGDYQTIDGWIKLHTNATRHKKAVLSVLGCKSHREDVKKVVRQLYAEELETAVLMAGGCAAEMRSLKSWKAHPQGQSISKEPTVNWENHGSTGKLMLKSRQHKPLEGIKVLDLTRVIAGPVATRFLAGYGADILRIDPINLWDDSANAPEMTLGKRCAGLDLNKQADHDTFVSLLSEADVFIHGYRPGALENLGFDEQRCRQINSNLIVVSLCAYGWSGPWSNRRGFDSLVQMSSGIAESGMRWKNINKPHPLPVQALDHATGYFMAAAVLQALREKTESGTLLSAKLSLAKTADLLSNYSATDSYTALQEINESDFSENIEHTEWGLAKRLKFPVDIEGCSVEWQYPAAKLRTSTPKWTR
jgi:hypothetical protein